MRAPVTAERVRALLEALGHAAQGPGDVFLTGGGTAVLHGWRASTVDVDLKLDPEPPGIFQAIERIKHDLDVNIELAAPDQFLPALPGWRERSAPIAQHGPLRFFHYDYYAQALAKIERAYERDLADVRAMLAAGLVGGAGLRQHFAAIEPELVRFPSVDRDRLRRAVEAVADAAEGADG